MYGRLKQISARFKVKRAIAAGDKIRVVIDKDGNEAIFSFDLEPKPPYKNPGLVGVDIGTSSVNSLKGEAPLNGCLHLYRARPTSM